MSSSLVLTNGFTGSTVTICKSSLSVTVTVALAGLPGVQTESSRSSAPRLSPRSTAS